MATEDEGDEEANNSGSGGDRQGGNRQHRVGRGDRQDGEIDRMANRKEIDSIATRRQRLGGDQAMGGKQEF
jgi:hypothetical protein